MPVTRSITRTRAAATPPVVNVKRAPKRRAESDSVVTKRIRSSSKATAKVKPEGAEGAVPRPLIPPSGEELAPLPAKLIFSLEDAKDHLVRADRRFRDVFSRLPCKPFETLENVQPFRTLCTSIIGQQISWLAARAIQHKFLRLFFPELPEKPDEQYWTKTRQDVFPTAYQVATTDLTTLKAAGLSGRKAEYVRDLATRFADGRLTNQKLLDANDDELLELLTAVYGIGKWTVEMFAIFSLRRPDILPVGDLGVQRGLLRWVLSQHQSEFRIEISPKKLPGLSEDPRKAKDKATPKRKSKPKSKFAESGERVKGVSASDKMETDSDQEVEEGAADELPSLNGLPDGNANAASIALPVASAARTTAPAPGALGLSSMPPPLTPSVTRILTRTPDAPPPPPLPAGLTVTSLRSRLGGKNKIKGAILTPLEMEALTESWRPYRSIGVYYMWALAEEKAES